MSGIGDTRQQSTRGLRSVVVVGGGVTGWMAAATLARVLAPASCAITVVEPDGAGPEGGQGALPNVRAFHGLLDIDERDFLRATRATFKLATRFREWSAPGATFLHPFGAYGVDLKHELFQAYWL